MTVLTRRVKIARIIFWVYGMPMRLWYRALRALVPIVIAVVSARVRRRHRALLASAAELTKQCAAVSREVAEIGSLSETRKRVLLAINAALQKKADAWRASRAALSTPPEMVVITPVLDYLLRSTHHRQHKTASFKQVIGRIDADTFYFDLLLWFVLPAAFSDDLLGDLNERYVIKCEKDGRVRAHAWYRHQVKTTLADCFWQKLCRLAAVATLLDILTRWRKK